MADFCVVGSRGTAAPIGMGRGVAAVDVGVVIEAGNGIAGGRPLLGGDAFGVPLAAAADVLFGREVGGFCADLAPGFDGIPVAVIGRDDVDELVVVVLDGG